MKNCKTRVSLSRLKLVNQLFLLALAVALSGCASINRLREAQDSFNQAAAAENAARLGGQPSQTTASLASIRTGYASALLSLGKLEPKDQESLQSDGLWGTALTLKAVCQWRLGQFDDALTSANQATTTTTNQLYPRDQAMLAALPGLIKTDQAYAKIMGGGSLDDIEALLIGPNGAIANILAARAMADKNHPVQIYLLESQLAAFRNYTVALDKFHKPPIPHTDPAYINAMANIKELDRLVKLQGNNPDDVRVVNYWGEVCGLSIP